MLHNPVQNQTKQNAPGSTRHFTFSNLVYSRSRNSKSVALELVLVMVLRLKPNRLGIRYFRHRFTFNRSFCIQSECTFGPLENEFNDFFFGSDTWQAYTSLPQFGWINHVDKYFHRLTDDNLSIFNLVLTKSETSIDETCFAGPLPSFCTLMVYWVTAIPLFDC